ncbi:acetyl-CoA synthetase-like protein [Daedalea quercina L-15889]|uniref:Acetyl-CoA synthetase-like protein n=1 Tax=Daedalea quercina L-15889 TaxID=1314783 RepID=A0A165MJ86_9APHY|nr:acetyl-CoA synthetase-like protein [Daedalea quercina L-15889]
MTVFHSKVELHVPPPGDVTLAQFMLDGLVDHPHRAKRPRDTPWFIDEETGKEVFEAEVITRTDAFARAMYEVWKIVALYTQNHIDYVIATWAAHRLGAIAALISPVLTTDELIYQLEIARPCLLIAHISNLATALEAARATGLAHDHVIVFDAHKLKAQLPSGTRPFEEVIQIGLGASRYPEYRLKKGEAKTKIAVLCYSSGTTGKPKAVAISHYNMMCIIVQTATTWRVNEEYAPVEDTRVRPGDRCAAGGSLCMIGAAPLTAELTSQLLEVLPHIQLGQGYGTCKRLDATWPLSQKVGTFGSSGQLVAGTTVKIVKPDGSLAGVGEPGELWVKGAQVVLGYYGNPEAYVRVFPAIEGCLFLGTRETFREDGWLRTGDEGFMSENGELFVTDRIKELIKVRGHQVAPAELEGHLLAHPAVADAGVVGVPDDYSGEVPLAFVVLHPSQAAISADPEKARVMRETVYEHVAQAKSRHKWLAGGVEFVDAIPKSASGKILRRVLRERARVMPRTTRVMEMKVKL